MQEEIAALHREKADLIEIGQGLYKQIAQLRKDKAELVEAARWAVIALDDIQSGELGLEEQQERAADHLRELEAAIAKARPSTK